MNFEEKTFIENYERLKSSRKMAELYNCSKSTILKYAKKIGYDNNNNKEKKITNFPIEEVIKDYEELKSAKKVGEKYNCSSTAVLNYLKNNNYIPKNFNNKLDNITKEEFIEKYEELKSAEKVGKYFNCSSTAILNYAKKIGYDVTLNKEYKLSEKDKKDIILAYNSEISSNDLAEKYNVSRGMITKLWLDAGLKGKRNSTGEKSFIDLTGQKFGKWEVMYKTDVRKNNGSVYWHCKCECGIERDVASASLRNGLSLSCGAHSNISKGNEKIKQILLEANIPFEMEKIFEDCKDINPLPFDFYINNKYLIEYDGSHHYKSDTIFDYEYTRRHDLIKSEWCKNNNIPLIRIPYTHFKDLELKDLILESSSFVE